jgi:hypothetical protein
MAILILLGAFIAIGLFASKLEGNVKSDFAAMMNQVSALWRPLTPDGFGFYNLPNSAPFALSILDAPLSGGGRASWALDSDLRRLASRGAIQELHILLINRPAPPGFPPSVPAARYRAYGRTTDMNVILKSLDQSTAPLLVWTLGAGP